MSQPPIEEEPEIVEGWDNAPVAGDRIDLHEGPIVAGDPDGARVEVTGDGVHAYNSDGVETAHIKGEGGEFVGGSFRTSDHLPGRVTLANDAYINSATGVPHPGIRVEPLDTSTMARPPGIGPGELGVYVDGGSDTSGRRSHLRANPDEASIRATGAGGEYGVVRTSAVSSSMRTYGTDGEMLSEMGASATGAVMRAHGTDGEYGVTQTSPTAALMRTVRADGGNQSEMVAQNDTVRMRIWGANRDYGWVDARPGSAEVAYVDENNTYFSRVRADAHEAYLFTRAGGVSRYLTVDADGIWVKTGSKSYNLEETAQDSGWQSLDLASGISGAGSPAWRNKGGVIYFRGTVNATWTDGWNTVATGLPAEMRPNVRVVRTSPSTGGANLLFRMDGDGLLQFYRPGNGTVQGDLSGLFYPLG